MVSGRKGLGEGGMLVNGDGRKGNDFDIDVLFLLISFFLYFFADGKFATFVTPVMEGDSRRGGRLSLQVRCGG